MSLQAQLLDCSFGTDGAVAHGISNPQTMAIYTSGAHAGKFLVGYSINSAQVYPPFSNTDFGLARFNADGTLDNTFGTNGIAPLVDFYGLDDILKSVLIRSDDKIVLVGTAREHPTFGGVNYYVAMARYTANGALDTSFDGDGKKTYLETNTSYGEHAYLGPNNDIIVAGGRIGVPQNGSDYVGAVYRFSETGASTGTGIVNFDSNGDGFQGPRELFEYVAPQGTKIISVGELDNAASPSNSKVMVARWDGSNLDATFNGGGTQLIEIVSSTFHRIVGLKVQSDNKILIAVDLGSSSDDKYNLIRLNADGGLDNTFGTNGVQRFEVGNTTSSDDVYAMVLDASGRAILVGNPGVINNRIVNGQNLGNINYEYAAVRFNTSGQAETTFGVDKVNGFDQSGAGSPVDAVLDANGKLLILGSSHFVKMEVVTNVAYCPPLPCDNAIWYKDADNDGYSDGSTLTQCTQPAGYKLAANLTNTSGDCDDSNAAINPNTTWYKDADNDGYSDGSTLTQCTQPAGYKLAANLTNTSGDCDDSNAAINPNTAWYLDADNDNYYTGSAVTQCTSPGTGYRYAGLVGGDDCNDGNAAINPGAPEICDNVDNNCNNTIDDGINCCPSTSTLYVNDDAAGNNDGNSWANAFNNLQDALALAGTCSNITEIWVATGTYKPTSGTDRNISFSMKNGVAILGGFPNTGNPGLADRNWTANVTTLSGDIGTIGDNSDNSFHVIYNGYNPLGTLNNSAVLDGFTISGGNGEFGGGMYMYEASPTITNCTFSGNHAEYHGGGLYIDGNALVITNCSFIGNSCNGRGGGIIFNSEGNSTVNNCIFNGNSADEGGAIAIKDAYAIQQIDNCTFIGNNATNGGGVYTLQAYPILKNCILSNNSASANGGGVFNDANSVGESLFINCKLTGNSASQGSGMYINTSAVITNCSFNGNPASSGSGIYFGGLDYYDDAPMIMNSILWGNGTEIIDNNEDLLPIVTYSIVQGGYSGTGNQDVDPLFVDAANGDLHLQACSPAIDAGDDAAVPSGTTTDLDGNPRFFNGGTVDMGTYEYQGTPTFTTWYADVDGDGFGDPNASQVACLQPSGYVADNTDCDDSNNALNPTTAWYLDADNDNYYTGGAVTQCTSPGTGYRYIGLVGGNDCDDGNPAINPGAPEICDNLDNNCNNAIDDGINCCPAGTVLYVNDDAAGNNDGNSWANAFNDLQDALALANTCPNITAIWVAAGTYKPTSGTDRTVSFSMKNGVAILGGFPSTGNPGLADRNWAGNVTTLSGDIGTAGDMADNSYHVISNDGNGLNNMAVLDGFTISGGNADDNSGIPFYRGGGMVNNGSSPTVSNCIFFGNYAGFGGGMSNRGSSFPIVTDCSFTNNSSSLGGGMHNNDASPVVTNCSFYHNTSSGSGGGMANFLSSSPTTLTNCTFFGNSAPVGGGMFNSSSSPMIINCNFSGNSSPNGEGIRNVLANPTIVNSIFWDSGNEIANASGSSPIVKNSIIKGGYTPCTDCPGSNGNVDPFFVDASNGDLHLIACSPAINAGDNASVPTGVITDLDGNPRFFNGGTVDIGAYEFQGTPTPVVAICQSQTVNLDAGGSASLPASALDGGSTGCGTLSFEVDLASTLNYSCTDIGTNLVTLTVTDERGQTASCSTTITVVDNVAPQALCQNVTVQLDANGNRSTSAEVVDNGSNDACGIASLALSQTSFDCSEVGANTETLTVIDNNGNVNTCMATITVEDNIDPVALCQNLTVQLDANGNSSTSAEVVDNGSSDACGIASFALSQTSFDCSEVGANTETLTVTDNNGNVNTCVATIMVEDNIDPVALCQNLTVQLDANGDGSTSAEVVDNGSSDACGIASLALSQTSFDCSEVGANTETLTVIDNNGNVNTCVATITVEDNIDPVALCQNLTVQLDANGDGSTSAEVVNNGSSDACGIASLALSQTSFDCADVGSNTVTLTVNDNNGNSSTCAATVTVQDNTDPVISQCEGLFAVFNGEQTIEAASVIDFMAADACGILSTTFSPATISCDQLGQNVEVLVTVADINGNSSECLAIVKTEGLPCGFIDFGDDGIDCEGSSNVEYDASTETFTLESNGCVSTSFAQDNAAYTQSELCGDGEIIVHVTSIDPLGQGWAGITLRESEAPGAKKVELLVNLSNIIRRAIRFTTNGHAYPAQIFRPGSTWLKLVRTGNQFLGYASANGVTWQNILLTNISMNTCIQAGLMVTNYNENSIVSGTFDQVTVNQLGSMGLQLPNTGQEQSEVLEALDFNVFPNPATDRLFVDLTNFYGQEAELEIFNQLGQLMHKRRVKEITITPEQFDLTQLKTGTHFIRITTKKGDVVKRFLIVK